MEQLVPAWEALRKRRRPWTPERALVVVSRPIDPDERLIEAGFVEQREDRSRVLTETGKALAREWRAELDAFVVDEVRPSAGLSRRTVRLGALLSLTPGEWRTVWPSAHGVEKRLLELRRELLSDYDAVEWNVIDRAVRRATSDSVGY